VLNNINRHIWYEDTWNMWRRISMGPPSFLEGGKIALSSAVPYKKDTNLQITSRREKAKALKKFSHDIWAIFDKYKIKFNLKET